VARTLLIVTALIETPIGVTLLGSPAPVVALLLGVSLEAAGAAQREQRSASDAAHDELAGAR
jgi:hypothetical protein